MFYHIDCRLTLYKNICGGTHTLVIAGLWSKLTTASTISSAVNSLDTNRYSAYIETLSSIIANTSARTRIEPSTS